MSYNYEALHFNYEYRCLNNVTHQIDRKWMIASYAFQKILLQNVS